MNKVILVGNLGQDAEAKETSGGKQLAKFSVATRGFGKDAPSDWHNVVFWDPKGVLPYLTKGAKVAIDGRLQTRKWEDKEGQTRYTTEVVAFQVELVGSKSERQHGVDPHPTRPVRPARPAPLTHANDDDIPF